MRLSDDEKENEGIVAGDDCETKSKVLRAQS